MKLPKFLPLIVLLPIALAGCTLKDTSTETPGAIPAPPDVAAPPANALRTPSGLASKVLTVGLGSAHPTLNSVVKVHYTVWTPDGRMVETTAGREPAQFQVDAVIAGWVEALQLMVAGEKRRFWIPGKLAYDNSPDPKDPKGMLVFDIELLEIR
jgi:FKBP-type peptidyl-prolyl cis-trans isomerase